jgi:Predicted integral membrane protein
MKGQVLCLKTRQEIKAQAKLVFMADYWKSVGVAVVYMLIMFAIGGTSGALAIFGPITCAAAFFVMPLALGLISHFVKLYQGEKPQFETMFIDGFSTNYLRKVGGMAWMTLWIFIWSLLFWIPGFVKGLSYSMTPYILTFCPNVKAKDALKLSMRIMEGNKADLFVFYLSYIGWGILNVITCGLLGIFYVYPYFYTSLYGYLDELFTNALAKGVITKTDLVEYEIFDSTFPPQ